MLKTKVDSELKRLRVIKQLKNPIKDGFTPDQSINSITQIYHFDSLRTFLKFLEQDKSCCYPFTDMPPLLKAPKLISDYSIRQVRNVFNSVDNFDNAMYLAKKGWRDGVRRVADWEAEISKNFSREIDVPSFFPSLTGGDVDVDAYLRGEPENMVDSLPNPVVTRSPRLFVDLNLRCDACSRRGHDANPTPPDWTLVRGAAISLLTKLFIRYNMRPEIVVGTSAIYSEGDYRVQKAEGNFAVSTISPKKRVTLITLYKPGEIFDLDKIVFCLAHDSFIRKLQFRFEEIMNIAELEGVPHNGYNYTVGHESNNPHMVGSLPLRASNNPAFTPNFDYEADYTDADIVIPSYPVLVDEQAQTSKPNDFESVKSATSWLLNILEEKGIKFV